MAEKPAQSPPPSEVEQPPYNGCGIGALRRVLNLAGPVEWLLLLAVLATVLTAFLCIHLGAEAVKEKILIAADKDKLDYFVLFLLWAAVVLAVGAIYIKWRIGRLDFSNSGIGKESFHLAARIFRFRCMLIGGGGWGLLFASFPFIFNIYGDTPDLPVRLSGFSVSVYLPNGMSDLSFSAHLHEGLSVFLFSINMITGAVLMAMIALLRQSWQLAQLDKTITLFSRSTPLSTDYTALLRTMTLIAAAHILLVLISVSFSRFPTPWLLVFAIFSISILLAIYYLPQMPVKRRLEAEKIELLELVGSAKKQILYSKLTPEALDHLGKLNALEEKVGGLSTSLSQRDDAWVKWSAWVIGLLPYVGSLLAALGASSNESTFVKALSDLLPVLKVLFGIPD